MTILHSFVLFCFIAGRFLASPPMYLFVRQWKRPWMLNQTMKGFLLAPVALGVIGQRKAWLWILWNEKNTAKEGMVRFNMVASLVEEIIRIHWRFSGFSQAPYAHSPLQNVSQVWPEAFSWLLLATPCQLDTERRGGHAVLPTVHSFPRGQVVVSYYLLQISTTVQSTQFLLLQSVHGIKLSQDHVIIYTYIHKVY